jgi:hypothetical protein
MAGTCFESLALDIQYKNMLYDFYGALLTDRQRECFTMHYMDDLSLAEIGDKSGTTPQAAADLLKRSCALLDKYEQKLSLVKKLGEQKAQVRQMNEQLTAIAAALMKTGFDELAEMTETLKYSINQMIL